MFRRALFASSALGLAVGLFAISSCSPPTPADAAAVSAAAAAAAAAIQGIIVDVQAMATKGGLTLAALDSLSTLIGAMQAQVTTLLTPVSAAAAPVISTVFQTITALLQQAAAYLPLILPIIAAVGGKAGAALPRAMTVQQSSLAAHYGALKVQAGA